MSPIALALLCWGKPVPQVLWEALLKDPLAMTFFGGIALTVAGIGANLVIGPALEAKAERRTARRQADRDEYMARQAVRRLKARESVYQAGTSTLGGERGLYEAQAGVLRARRQTLYEADPTAFQDSYLSPGQLPAAPVSRYLSSSSLDSSKATELALQAVAQNGADPAAWRRWEAEMRQRFGADGERVVAIARSLRGGRG